jgi:hypothetical protein
VDKQVAEAVNQLSVEANRIANAITPVGAAPGHDPTGGTVNSLTEAVMGVTAGLVRVAEAIEILAEAVKESKCAD